jgi:hypothetical protein
MRVAAIGQLDFNHLAAKVSEQAAGVGAGHMAADIDASGTFEGSGDHARLDDWGFQTSLTATKDSFPAGMSHAKSLLNQAEAAPRTPR